MSVCECGNGEQMAALRFQTGDAHQTSRPPFGGQKREIRRERVGGRGEGVGCGGLKGDELFHTQSPLASWLPCRPPPPSTETKAIRKPAVVRAGRPQWPLQHATATGLTIQMERRNEAREQMAPPGQGLSSTFHESGERWDRMAHSHCQEIAFMMEIAMAGPALPVWRYD